MWTLLIKWTIKVIKVEHSLLELKNWLNNKMIFYKLASSSDQNKWQVLNWKKKSSRLDERLVIFSLARFCNISFSMLKPLETYPPPPPSFSNCNPTCIMISGAFPIYTAKTSDLRNKIGAVMTDWSNKLLLMCYAFLVDRFGFHSSSNLGVWSLNIDYWYN